MSDEKQSQWVSDEDVLMDIAQNLPSESVLGFFYGYATGGGAKNIKSRWQIKRYDASCSTDRGLLTRIFALADMPAPAALMAETGMVARKDVAKAFGIAAKKAGIPMLERTWMRVRVRLGAQRTI